jgi:hypothetical protein
LSDKFLTRLIGSRSFHSPLFLSLNRYIKFSIVKFSTKLFVEQSKSYSFQISSSSKTPIRFKGTEAWQLGHILVTSDFLGGPKSTT